MEDVIKRFLAVDSGYGFSYGYGDGNGAGYGYGYGAGILLYNGMQVHIVDNMQTIITSVHGQCAKGFILQPDLTLEPCYIAKVDNHFAHGKTLHEAQADATAKALQDMPIEERIEKFIAQYPSLDTVAKNSDLFRWHNTLTGSCTMGREEFAKSHGIDVKNGSMTIQEFIDLTKYSYMGENIISLENEYEYRHN